MKIPEYLHDAGLRPYRNTSFYSDLRESDWLLVFRHQSPVNYETISLCALEKTITATGQWPCRIDLFGVVDHNRILRMLYDDILTLIEDQSNP